MMSTAKFVVASLLVAFAAVLSGCGGGASNAPAVKPPVTLAAKLTISTSSLPAGTFGQFYSTTLKATGGAPPYQWLVASGDPLSGGLTLDMNSGALSGILTGNIGFQAAVVDSKNNFVTANFTVPVNNPPVKIITTVLPPATVQQPYDVPILLNEPLNFAGVSISGSLPPGLTGCSDSPICGKPTASGTFNVTVTASGPGGSTDQRTLTLLVRDKGVRNDELSTATPISNGMWNASISPYADPVDAPHPDQDFYSLTAQGGSFVSVNVLAQRLSPSSPLQGVLTILDGNGQVLQTCNQPGFIASFNNPCMSDQTPAEFTFDPMLTVQVPGSGTQTIYLRVLDWRGDARPDMAYQVIVFGAN
jgi:hypothetical protein